MLAFLLSGVNMAHVNQFHGRSIRFGSGLSVGFNWVHGNGRTSKTSAVLASYHHPESITWRWALDWVRPTKLLVLPRVQHWKPNPQATMGSFSILLPLIGAFAFRWQAHMFRKAAK